MKMSFDFQNKLTAARQRLGETEYHVSELEDVVAKLIKEDDISTEQLVRMASKKIVNDIEKNEDKPQQKGFFDYESHVALGEGIRVKRGKMNYEQHVRRESVIDKNFIAQSRAYAEEKDWISEGKEALKGKSTSTSREDVLPIAANDNESQKVAA